MMRRASSRGDPYNYRDALDHAYRDPLAYRDYRDPYRYGDPMGYGDPYDYRDNVRETASHSRKPKPVGSVTNSDDFASKDSRLFVGNLNTVVLSKEDVNTIFGRLGNVTGISMHKGYAFVQFSNPGEARRAMALESGQVYAGQALDLNVVSEPKVKGAQKRVAGPTDGYQRQITSEKSLGPGPAAKRARQDVNPSMQSNLVTLADSDQAYPRAYRRVTNNAAEYQEPEELMCARCDSIFSSAWGLCLHVQQRHNIAIFRTQLHEGR